MTWWRRQRRALLALVVASIAVVAVQLWFQVLPRADAGTPQLIVAEGTTELGGQRLTYTGSRWDEFDAPEGSRTLSVRLRGHSDPESDGCGTFTLTETTTDRVWLPAGSAVDVDSDDSDYCETESASYRLLAVFLLPDDTAGPFWLDIPVGDQRERLRFRVDG